MAKNDAKDAKDALVEVVIFRGTYVTAEGTFAPGATVKVEPEEAAWLKAHGRVKPDDYAPPAEVQDGQVKILAQDGPTVTTTVA
jgi:hypothetical protein